MSDGGWRLLETVPSVNCGAAAGHVQNRVIPGLEKRRG
jgi:hypothetical protein